MSTGFPQRANINKNIYTTIMSRAGNNKLVSEKLPWIKVTSCLNKFLSLESTPLTDSFNQRYGSGTKSGRIGIDRCGESVYANDINDINGIKFGDDRSLRPSPIIESIAITQGKEGLSKKTNFTIKAFTQGQAEALVQYFLEPGGNVLVEWGFNEQLSVTQKAEINFNAACNVAAYQSIKYLTDKRKKSKGTYDAVLGIITGGSMAFGDAETYNIEVEITSVGEIPAYLQHHNNIRTGVEYINNSGKKFEIADINDDANNDKKSKTTGRALFKQMYNELPSHKQIIAVKNLQYEKWATDEGLYVNIDKVIREKIIAATKKGELHTAQKIINEETNKEEKLIIPTDTPLFDNDRFIKASLAFTILDLTHSESKPTRIGCKKSITQNIYINWRNTIIKAHKNIFSTDGSKLMIPNMNSPDFDLASATLPDRLDKNGEKKDFEPIQLVGGYTYGAKYFPEKIKTVEKGTIPHGGDHEFPKHIEIEYQGSKKYDNDYECIKYGKYNWGYLKDLYINFDFFKQCISSKGLLSKDVYYKILNGLSSACNMNWDFQLIETGFSEPQDISDKCVQWWNSKKLKECKNGDNELKIVCFNTTGNTTNQLGQAKFQSRGLNSPFLSAELNFDIPSSMKGQMVMQKNSTRGATPNSEQADKDFRGLFTGYRDSVNEILNPFRDEEDKEREREEEERKEQENFDRIDTNSDGKHDRREKGIEKRYQTKKLKERKKLQDESRKANYENFASKTTVVPRFQYRGADMDIEDAWGTGLGGDANIEDIMMTVAYNDSELLKNVEDFNRGKVDGIYQSDEEKERDAIALPIKFNFTIHGISGIKVGDTFNITDLPGIYKKKVFTVTQLEHNIEQTIWKTSIQSMLVSIDASVHSYDAKSTTQPLNEQS